MECSGIESDSNDAPGSVVNISYVEVVLVNIWRKQKRTHSLISEPDPSQGSEFLSPSGSACGRGIRWWRVWDGERDIYARIDSSNCHFIWKGDGGTVWIEHCPVECHDGRK